MTCPEGLIYDKNLLSCAIPSDDWDCPLTNSAENYENSDDDNVLGVENLRILNDDEDSRQAKDESDEFLAVIDGDENLRNDDEVSNFSGDGEVENYVTPSAATKRMITTQVQRLTQLVNKIAKGTNEDLNADDLNSFLDRQRIQYENFGDDESEKTTLPDDGKVHPEVVSEIVYRQNNLKQLTTLSMDKVTTTMRPFEIIDKNQVAEIKLKSGQGLESGSHQIVVNRPEGSVLFNVPATPVTKNQPYLSADILKTILELSKNLVTNNQKTASSPVNYQPQPVYYAIPVPIYQHQNYYGSNYSHPIQNQQDFSRPIQSQPSYSQQSYSLPHLPPTTTTTTTTQKPKVEIKNNLQNGYYDSVGNYYYYSQTNPTNNYPQANPSKNYPSYSNYPSYAYQQYGYNPYYNFYQQYPQNSYSDQNGNFNNAAYYEKRPFVTDSSAPYVEHQKPFRKETYNSGYESDDEGSDDELFDDEPPPPPDPTEGLICTNVLARQANKTDCFKYYVCNAKTKEILSYTCPPMTAFNDLTKFCDSSSYKDCKKMQDNENKNSIKRRRIVSEAQKVLAQAKRESQKAERIASLMRKESQKLFYNRNQFTQPSNNFYEYQKVYQPVETTTEAAQEEEFEIPIVQTVAKRRTTTTRSVQVKKKKKSKKVKCTVLGAIADPEDEKVHF